MPTPIAITILVENTARGRTMLGEHGLAYFIEIDNQRILFDTGQTGLIARNAETLGVDLTRIDDIVLSHGHYDHTGGLATVLDIAQASGGARLIAHPDVFIERYSRSAAGDVKPAGAPGISLEDVQSRARDVVITREPVQLSPSAITTGAIPRDTNYEDVGGDFFLDPQCTQRDDIPDDQALVLDARDGLIIILGCAHAGVVNTLEHARRLRPDRPIAAILGGMHLLHASDHRLNATIEALQAHDIPLLAPCHCTGARATARLWRAFESQCAECCAGSRFTFKTRE